MKSRNSGQITVFAAIILLAVLMLAGVLVDISRISAGRAMVKRAADTAAKSLLADYGSRLKEGYGMFAMPASDLDDLQVRFEEYISSSLSIPYDEEYYEENTDLFGFRIEKINVTPIFNLSENNVTKKQILEYMKYRAPEELVEGFMERLSAVKDVGKMSAAYKKKVGIDKMLGSMDKAQQNLKKNVDGAGKASDKYINGFNLDGSWEAAYNRFNSLSESLASIKSSLDSLDNSIDELEALKSQRDKEKASSSQSTVGSDGTKDNNGTNGMTGTNSAASTHETICDDSVIGTRAGISSDIGNNSADGVDDKKSAEEDFDEKLDSLKKDKADLQQNYSDTGSLLNQIWKEIRTSLTSDYIKSNENAAKEIEKIAAKGKKAQQAIAELESYLAENFSDGDGTFSKDFKEQSQSELDALKKLILDGQKAEEMLNNVGSNSSLLENIISKLDEASIYGDFSNSSNSSSSSSSSLSGLPSELLSMVKDYSSIIYNYSKPDKGDKNSDPRAGKADAIKEFITEKILKDVNYKTEGIDEKDLPSNTKVETKSFDQEDEDFIADQSGVGENSGGTAVEAVYEGDLGNIDSEVDLYDEDGMFQENALGFISEIGELVAGEAAVLRDNIYLNEYIMGTFKNSVSVMNQGMETVKDTNLHGIEKDRLQTFYDSEVEYVLHGNASQSKNNIMTKGELLLVRFGLDTLHVYTDSKKKAMATSIATAVAGWWTGGAGIPVISNLIMCGWGMGEALIDLKALMEGKSVPIYKMQGDWKLDIGLPVAAGSKTDKRLYFNYHDYLRLFLLTMDENKKLDRLEDLIQLNLGKSKSGFRMSESNTFVRVEAEVSMKYLFVTQPFVQREMKTNDGRYVFKVLVYEGY